MKKKTVLITGASSGIGKATALYFGQSGWQVAATMRRPEQEKTLSNQPGIKLFRLDVTDGDTIRQAFDDVEKAMGPVSVVVNNAGFGVDGIFEEMSDEVVARQFDTNVFGVMRMTREAIKRMRIHGGGTIVQVASMGGRLSLPLYSIYHGSKWAVEGFSEALHFELRPLNIRIRIIEPGTIKTEFYGRGREFIKPYNTVVYDEFVRKAEKVSMDNGRNGEDPGLVAETIFKAALATGWRLRYPVGKPAPLLLWLRKMIPDSWYFAIVRNNYGI